MANAKYSPSTNGIYPTAVYEEFPEDAFDIPDELYDQFRAGELPGFTVVNGVVQGLSEQPPTLEEQRAAMRVTAFQAHAVIHRHGLYSAVEAILANPETDFETKLAWEKAQHFSRLSPAVLDIAAQLGLTDIELDAMFAEAALIEA